MPKSKSCLYLSAVLIFTNFLVAPSFGKGGYSSSEILLNLNKLKVLGTVLYIAAHPDDENTAVLTYMSKRNLFRTGYLSLTRGDGGQNLLGKEKGDLLGVIRTQELISARKNDGADQFFTRAVDFGYSKSPTETLKHWKKEKLLGDVVKVVREFRPDVILTRFSKSQGGHGHHLVSAILAEEAFFAAWEENMYPEQLKHSDVWQPKRVYWNTWRPSNEALSIDIGEYNTFLGKSYNEISAYARSMHKSQGFGVSPDRGSQLNYFDHIAGEKADSSLFEDIDISWNRLAGGSEIENNIDKIIEKFDPSKPESIVSDLVTLYQLIGTLKDKYWIKVKQDEIKELILKCAGIWVESTVLEPELFRGDEVDVRSMILVRSGLPVRLNNISTSFGESEESIDLELDYNKPHNYKHSIRIPTDADYSQPYWLEERHNGKLFNIPNDYIGKAQNSPALITNFNLSVNDFTFSYSAPVIHKWTDAVKGGQFRPVVIRPELSISVNRSNYIFSNGRTNIITAEISAQKDSVNGKLFIELPEGWKTDKSFYDFELGQKGERSSFDFYISPSSGAKSGQARIAAEVENRIFDHEVLEIDYPHIAHQTVLKPVMLDLVNFDIIVVPKIIGYIMGSGDEIPSSLAQLGYKIIMLSDEEIEKMDLSEFDVIICGIRAFNTREKLERLQSRLVEFVNNGGTWIVQHNTRFGFQVDQIGPYPFSTSGRDRISEEDAPIEILDPDHQIFNFPNKIRESDFDGWVQERGLYFANSWEGKLYPLLAGNDQGESAKLGGLLYSDYGKGVFIFTAYSWFRQLPAGIPGAYKLFVNIISAKGK